MVRPPARAWLAISSVFVAGCLIVLSTAFKPDHAPGCKTYQAAPDVQLIAHAGGGLPDRSYPNSLAALDLSYRHGLRYFEIDFWTLPFGIIRVAHSRGDLIWGDQPSVDELLAWFRAHPDAWLITDFKRGAIEGLQLLAKRSGSLRHRIIPQIYEPAQYRKVAGLGFHKPIFTLYANRDPNWEAFAQRTDLWAITMPLDRATLAPRLSKPVFVHTVNEPVRLPGVAGLYTDCLIPERAPSTQSR